MDLFDAGTWENYDAAGLSQERLSLIKRFIPVDVKTILDAGCGNGAINNALQGDYDITGLDFSPAALEHVKTKKVLASVTSIPFADGAFDLCMANEVLEHLNTPELLQAVQELKRCARKFLLVSVPNREQLERGLMKCKACGKVFHAYGHVQSFDPSRLDELFGLTRIRTETLGPRIRCFNKHLLRFRQLRLKQWFNPSFPISCPECRGSEFWIKKSPASKLINSLGRINPRSKRYWLTILYQKTATVTASDPLIKDSD